MAITHQLDSVAEELQLVTTHCSVLVGQHPKHICTMRSAQERMKRATSSATCTSVTHIWPSQSSWIRRTSTAQSWPLLPSPSRYIHIQPRAREGHVFIEQPPAMPRSHSPFECAQQPAQADAVRLLQADGLLLGTTSSQKLVNMVDDAHQLLLSDLLLG